MVSVKTRRFGQGWDAQSISDAAVPEALSSEMMELWIRDGRGSWPGLDQAGRMVMENEGVDDSQWVAPMTRARGKGEKVSQK